MKKRKILFIGSLSLLILLEILALIFILMDYFTIYFIYFSILIVSGYIFISLLIILLLTVLFYRKKKIRKFLSMLLITISLIIFNILVIYRVNLNRRFLPYKEKISNIIQSDIMTTPKLKDVIIKLEEMNFYNNSQLDYIVGTIQYFSFDLILGNIKLRKEKYPYICTIVAITLMRDQNNINLQYSHMGEWHLNHFIWTFALNEYFSKDEILNLYCYYFFNLRNDVIDYAKINFGKEITECSEDDFLKLHAYLKFPGYNIPGTNDMTLSENNFERLEELRLEEYERLKIRLKDKR